MKWFRTLTTAFFVAFVAFSLGAAGTDLYGERASQCTGQGEIGECPDFGNQAAENAACECACMEIHQFGGSCDVNGCCLCQL